MADIGDLFHGCGPYNGWGFNRIELELDDGTKVNHKLVVFKSESREKSDELDEGAPKLGFGEDEEPMILTVGCWRK